MLSINIETQPIKMAFNSQKATLDLTTTTAELTINTEAAKLEIHQPNGELEIDQTSCRYAYGFKNMTDFTRDNAQAGRDSAVAAVGRIAADGDRLAHISSRENAVANIAADSTRHAPGELTWTYVPLPDIRYTPHAPQITVIEGQLNISSQTGSVQGDFNPAQVDINVVEYPSIKMWASPNVVDMMV